MQFKCYEKKRKYYRDTMRGTVLENYMQLLKQVNFVLTAKQYPEYSKVSPYDQRNTVASKRFLSCFTSNLWMQSRHTETLAAIVFILILYFLKKANF